MFTRRLEACSMVAVLALAACGGSQAPAGHRSASASRPPVRVRRQVSVVRTTLGHSVRGRTIEAVHLRSPGARRGVLVVGCIHGNEPAGIAIARRLDRERGHGLDLWVIDALNPDGV